MSNKKEFVDLLGAISIVSKHLAENLPVEEDTLPLIYVASPLAGDIEGNIKRANEHCRFVVANQAIPFAPHVLFTGFLNDEIKEERQIGRFLGKEVLRKCNALWAFCDNGEPSKGMQEEIELAIKLDIPVRYFRKESQGTEGKRNKGGFQ